MGAASGSSPALSPPGSYRLPHMALLHRFAESAICFHTSVLCIITTLSNAINTVVTIGVVVVALVASVLLLVTLVVGAVLALLVPL